MYYITSPIDTESEAYQLSARVARKLEKAGITVYLPQRDTDQQQPPKRIFAANIKALSAADGVIVILSETRGIYLEAGYAKALGKKLIGLKTGETKPVGNIVRNFFDYIVDTTDELIVLLEGTAHEEA
ncbi:MAG: nucleoside 2-deoxyribosyltransferase [Candidatus Aenigmarchaeota archaeon]|nr:nucleoside 2-deoxyribosyltransferase [Candidatus Aenigmarchaeota archaeon]